MAQKIIIASEDDTRQEYSGHITDFDLKNEIESFPMPDGSIKNALTGRGTISMTYDNGAPGLPDLDE